MFGQEILDGLQGSLRVVMIVADHSTGKDGFLPHILSLDFRRGDIKLAV